MKKPSRPLLRGDATPDALLAHLRSGVQSNSAEETESLGVAVAGILPANQFVALHGDLGVGKTTFVRGMARGWGIEEPVTSPTYNLFSLYPGVRQLVHFDAYRLNSEAELDALMIEDFLIEPWCLAIEWPERVAGWIPSQAWRFVLLIEPNGSHRIRLETP